MNISKFLLLSILLVISIDTFAYPWGKRNTYMDNVKVSKDVIEDCSFYYIQRNYAILAVHNGENPFVYFIGGKLRKEEAESFITVFCGFTKIKNGRPPRILGKATFSTSEAAQAYRRKHK